MTSAAALYNEIEPHAADWLRNLIAAGEIAPGHVDTRSIRDLRADDLAGFRRVHLFGGIGGWDLALQLAGWPAGLPVWTGSCPCQPFSAAGRRGGTADDRHLWPEMFRLVAECRPPIVFGEQVEAAVRLGWLDAVQADLEGAGYAFGAQVLGAHSVSAPHIRQRLWWVGVLADAERSGRRQELHDAQAGQHGPVGSGVHGGMAHSLGPRLEGRDARPLGHEREAAERGGAAGGVGDANSIGEDPLGRVHGRAAAQRSRSPWSDLKWLPCRDGKSRPTRPGLFPLAARLSYRLGSGSPFEGKSRVGMLRGAGNAIVPQVAAAFVRSVMDVLGIPAEPYPSVRLLDSDGLFPLPNGGQTWAAIRGEA